MKLKAVIFVAIIISFLCTKNEDKNLLHQNKQNGIKIDSIYEKQKTLDTIFFNTSTSKRNVLVCCKDTVWGILQTTKDNVWAMISRMPSKAEEAYGQNEQHDIYFVPTKRSITKQEIGYQSTYTFLSLFEKSNHVFVELDNGEKVDTFDLSAYANKNNYWTK